MAGVTGFIDFSNKSSENILKTMTATLKHRGPEADIVFEQQSDFQLGLGQSGASGTKISSFDNSFIVYDGLVYNYGAIKEELINMGHSFETGAESEVVLHAWKEWGEAGVHKFHGVFAYAIFDKNKNELTVVRDRPGVKPFYYYFNNGIFIFGSELKSLMAHPSFEKEIDKDVLASYLQYGYISAPYCIFKNANKLSVGHLLTFNTNRKIETRQYWNVYDYYNRPKLNISLPEAIEESEKILLDAFRLRMISDKPVGLFLSGGFDSCCTTALLQNDSTEKLKTFTIGTTSNHYNEAPFAKKIAEHLGTDHTEYYCTAQESLDIIPDLPYYYDEPYADSSAIPTTLVSKLAKQDVGAALSSDAGDEVFAGYNRYDYISRFGNKIKAIPKPLRKMMAGFMEYVPAEKIPVLKNLQNVNSRYDKIKNLLNDPSPEELLKNLSLVFTDKETERIFSHDVKFLATPHTSKELKPEYYDALAYMQAIDYQSYLPDDGCVKVDRASNSVSFEVRDPFFDHKIIEWAAQLPSDYKYHNGIKKYITREIVYKYIPKELMDRPKMGFGIPVQDWLLNELKPLVEEHLSGAALKHGLFNVQEVLKLRNDFFSGRKDKYLKIWYLLMFQMWYDRWMRKSS